MEANSKSPKTLQEAILYFSNLDNCLSYMAHRRWPDGVVTCPTCGRKDVSYLATQRKWQCKSAHAKRQFSPKVGTIFEDSPIGLDKWLVAVWMLSNCKNGVSSYELARTIGVTQKSAWFMLHRIRLAMQSKTAAKLGGNGGPVEVDETYYGGKPKNMHKDRRGRAKFGGKAIIMGMLERHGEVRAAVIPNAGRIPLHSNIGKHVANGATVYTDDWAPYIGIESAYAHDVIKHTETYVRGQVHTNGIENFWSLLKRGLSGTYVSVEPFHLDRYVDEQVFRFNNRKRGDYKLTDADRFDLAMSQIAGKRLTFAEVTGKTTTTHN